MDIKELQERLRGTYDLRDLVDCQSTISMLLRDLDAAHARTDNREHDLKALALAVRHNPEKAQELAEQALSKHKQPAGKVMQFLQTMAEEVHRAEAMTDDALTDDVLKEVWGDLDMSGRPSAVLEEMVARFKKLTGQKVGDDDGEG